MFQAKNRINFQDTLIAIFIVLFFMALGYLYTVPRVCGVYHDDAIYVSTAKALAQGYGYRIINLPNSPSQTKYPFLYPILLAFIWKLYPKFPENILFMQYVTTAISAISIGICYLYFVRFRYVSRLIAFFSCAVCITAPEFLYFATNTLSELPFLLLLVIALWIFDSKSEQLLNGKLQGFLLGILLTLPNLCRSIGAVVIISGLLLWRFKVGSVRFMMLGIILAIFPWIFWIVSSIGDFSHDPIKGYYTDYIGWWFELGAPFIGKIIITNLFHIFLGSAKLIADGFYELLRPLSLPFFLVPFMFFGLITWVTILFNKEKLNFLKWVLVSYFLIICIWPWPPYRFLIPVLPFIAANFFIGINLSFKRFLSHRALKVLNSSVFLVLISTNLFSVYKILLIHNNTGYPQTDYSEMVNWRSYENVFSWLRKNSSQDDIIACGLDTMIYLYTNRTAIRPFINRPISLFYGHNYPATGTVEDLMNFLKTYSPTYFVKTPMPKFSEEQSLNKLLDKSIETFPSLFVPVYTGEDLRFKIFKVDIHQLNSGAEQLSKRRAASQPFSISKLL